jgi:hypothetical protein
MNEAKKAAEKISVDGIKFHDMSPFEQSEIINIIQAAIDEATAEMKNTILEQSRIITHKVSRIAELEGAVKVKRKALKPFMAISDMIDDELGDDHLLQLTGYDNLPSGRGAINIQVSHFRRAAEAVKGGESD